MINKKCNKIKTEVFFYPSVTANLSSGGKGLSRSGILKGKTWTKNDLQLINSYTRHSEISKKLVWISLQVFVKGVEFSFQ
jgi:hypothetical protein